MNGFAVAVVFILVLFVSSSAGDEGGRGSDVHFAHRSRTKKADTTAALFADLSKIAELPVRLVTPTHSKRDSSYTKSWTNEDWERHQVSSLVRYGRHLSSWIRSPTAAAILPTVAVVCLWAGFVMFVSNRNEALSKFLHSGSFSSWTISSFSAPIALLLTLRTNRSLDRLLEARSQWGVAFRALVSLAGMTVYVKDHETALLMGRYLAIYGWCLKGLVRGETDSEVIAAVIPPDEAPWLISARDRPTAIVYRLRSILSAQQLSTAAHQAIEHRLYDLESALGICKRILASPVPPTYTRHTSRVLCLYLAMIPFALIGTDISPVALLVNVALTSYLTIGLDEICVEIENPFPILPIYYLCNAMQNGVANQFLLGANAPHP
jgi:ion channel-forming bestrophin family protein